MAGDQVRPLCTFCGGRFCTELMAKRYLGGGKLLEGLAAIEVYPADLERMTKDDGHILFQHYLSQYEHRKIYTMMCFDEAGTLSHIELYVEDEIIPIYSTYDVVKRKTSNETDEFAQL